MPRIRLTGLFLFITSIFLGLAAAATKTTHIDFKTPDQYVEQPEIPATAPPEETPVPIQFTSIPIIFPLAGVAALGLLLWFVPAAELPRKNTATPERKRRRRTTTRTRRLLGKRILGK